MNIQVSNGVADIQQSQGRVLEKLDSLGTAVASMTVSQLAMTNPQVLEDLPDERKEYWQQEGHKVGLSFVAPKDRSLYDCAQKLGEMIRDVNGKPYSSMVEVLGERMPRGKGNQIVLNMMLGLQELDRLIGVPPALDSLNGEVTRVSSQCVFAGVISEVWEGCWLGHKKVGERGLSLWYDTDVDTR